MEMETERLVLREFQAGDERFLVEYNRAPEARRYLRTREGTEQQVRAWVEGAIREANRHPRLFHSAAVLLKGQPEVIGKVVLVKKKHCAPAALIGWELNREFWGQGYMTEAMQAVTAFGVDVLGVTGYAAECFAANRASIRIMEKLGMTRERSVPAHPWVLAWQYNETRPIVRYRS